MHLEHHGIAGQKWGVKNGPPYPLENRVFVSGSWRISDPSSGYYRKGLPKEITNELDNYIRKKSRILVGDAPGVDSLTQDYLANKRYKKVDIYVTGNAVRKNADDGTLGWKVHKIDGRKYPEGSAEWHAVKDKAMTRASTTGLSVILPDGGAGATRRNVKRLVEQSKNVKVLELKDRSSSRMKDGWRVLNEVLNEPD